jgi:predicted amidohydrolase
MMKVGFLQFKPELLDTGRNIDTVTNFLKDIDFDLMVLPELAV